VKAFDLLAEFIITRIDVILNIILNVL